MSFVSEAEIDIDEQTAVFVVEEGGDYVVLTEKIHKDKKQVAVETEDDEDDGSADASQASDVSTTENADDGEADTDDDADKPVSEENEASKDDDEPVVTPEESETIKVSIDIRCDTLAADLSKLRDPALESYVPTDGCILSLTDVEVKKGATVYDVLDMVCRNKGIHLEATYTPSYGADYVEGINYLYEFDAGEQSGWMYTVNGVFPNYGCSDYV